MNIIESRAARTEALANALFVVVLPTARLGTLEQALEHLFFGSRDEQDHRSQADLRINDTMKKPNMQLVNDRRTSSSNLSA